MGIEREEKGGMLREMSFFWFKSGWSL